MAETERHVVVLWDFARSAEAQIARDLSDRFSVVAEMEIEWHKDRFSEQLTRFYGTRLPRRAHKERHCGTGPFLLFVIEAPVRRALRLTSSGPRTVNPEVFDAKRMYRAWTGGGHRVHASDTPAEADHDLMLVLGSRCAEVDATSERRRLKRPIIGSDGYSSLAELFAVLNTGDRWVIMRNWSELEDGLPGDDHPDIDLMVDDAAGCCRLLGATPTRRLPWRSQFRVLVESRPVLIDLRTPYDGYLPAPLAERMLDRRVSGPHGGWIPEGCDHFVSLLYHAVVHKPTLYSGYVALLRGLEHEIAIPYPASDDRAAWERYLVQLLRAEGLHETDPVDLSVGNYASGGPRRLTRRTWEALRTVYRLRKGLSV
jgi:hypothetical protein